MEFNYNIKKAKGFQLYCYSLHGYQSVWTKYQCLLIRVSLFIFVYFIKQSQTVIIDTVFVYLYESNIPMIDRSYLSYTENFGAEPIDL